jgi:hypothetical protein
MNFWVAPTHVPIPNPKSDFTLLALRAIERRRSSGSKTPSPADELRLLDARSHAHRVHRAVCGLTNPARKPLDEAWIDAAFGPKLEKLTFALAAKNIPNSPDYRHAEPVLD